MFPRWFQSISLAEGYTWTFVFSTSLFSLVQTCSPFFKTALKISLQVKHLQAQVKHLQNTCKTPAKHLQIFDVLEKRIGFVTPFRLRV